MTLKLKILRSLARSFIILVALTRSLFSEKMLISNRYISGLMPNLIKKKSWTVSTAKVWLGQIPIVLLCSAVPDLSVRLLLDSDIFYYGALSQLIFKKRCWLSVHLKKLHLPSWLKSVSSSRFCTGISQFNQCGPSFYDGISFFTVL